MKVQLFRLNPENVGGMATGFAKAQQHLKDPVKS